MKLRKTLPKKKTQALKPAEIPKPFIEHAYELRRRLVYIVGSILLFSTLAYFVQQSIVNFLLSPSNGQQFIYTSPIGGINFLFSVCIYTGVVASIPIIVYQLLGFFKPLIKDQTLSSMVHYGYFSGVLAVAGFCFGYYLGLPAALHFLGKQFTNNQVHPLFTVQEYMSFLTIYLLGSALLFQLPIILLFINRIKPLSPRRLLSFERYVIVGSFIVAMIMAPTPNILNQLIIVVPILLMYNLSILLVRMINSRHMLPDKADNIPDSGAKHEEDRLPIPTVPKVAVPLGLTTMNPPRNSPQPLASPGFMIMDIRPPVYRPGGHASYP